MLVKITTHLLSFFNFLAFPKNFPSPHYPIQNYGKRAP